MNNAQTEHLNRYSKKHSSEEVYREIIEMILSITKIASDWASDTDKVRRVREVCEWFENYECDRMMVKGGYRQ